MSYFLGRWSSDISPLRGCLSTDRITAGLDHVLQCSCVELPDGAAEGDQCVLDINECKDEDIEGGKRHIQQRNDHVSPVPVWVRCNVSACCSLLFAS